MSIFCELDILEHLISSEHAPCRSIRAVLYRLFLGTWHSCLEIHLPLIFYIISKGHWVCVIQYSCSLKKLQPITWQKFKIPILNSYFLTIVNFFTLRRGQKLEGVQVAAEAPRHLIESTAELPLSKPPTPKYSDRAPRCAGNSSRSKSRFHPYTAVMGRSTFFIGLFTSHLQNMTEQPPTYWKITPHLSNQLQLAASPWSGSAQNLTASTSVLPLFLSSDLGARLKKRVHWLNAAKYPL